MGIGTATDCTLTVVQSVNGTFNGTFDDLPDDRGLNGSPPSVTVIYKKLSVVKQGTGTPEQFPATARSPARWR